MNPIPPFCDPSTDIEDPFLNVDRSKLEEQLLALRKDTSFWGRLFRPLRSRFWHQREYAWDRLTSGRRRRLRRWIRMTFSIPAAFFLSLTMTAGVGGKLLGWEAIRFPVVDEIQSLPAPYFAVLFAIPVVLATLLFISTGFASIFGRLQGEGRVREATYLRRLKLLDKPTLAEGRSDRYQQILHDMKTATSYYSTQALLNLNLVRKHPVVTFYCIVLFFSACHLTGFFYGYQCWPSFFAGYASFVVFMTLIILVLAASAVVLGWFTLKTVDYSKFAECTVNNESDSTAILAGSEILQDILSDFFRRTGSLRYELYEAFLVADIAHRSAGSLEGQKRARKRCDIFRESLFEIGAKSDNATEDGSPDERRRVSSKLESLRRAVFKYENTVYRFLEDVKPQLRRAEAVKLEIAARAGLSERVLCDTLYRFSPSIFYERVSKLQTNLRNMRDELATLETLANLESVTPRELERYINTIRQAELIYRYALNGFCRQRQIHSCRKQLYYIQRLLRASSSSNAVQIYALAIQKASGTEPSVAVEALELLHSIQSLHPWLNAHSRLLDILSPTVLSVDFPSPWSGQNQTYDRLVDIESSFGAHRLDFYSGCGSLKDRVPPFKNLVKEVSQRVSSNRKNVVLQFVKEMDALAQRNSDKSIWILLPHYSAMVKIALQRLMNSESWGGRKDLRILFATGGDPSLDRGRRLLRAELMYEANLSPDQTESFPLSRISRLENIGREVKLVCLAGTEAYDDNKRFAMSLEDEVSRNIVDLADRRCLDLIVLAEHYKREDSLSSWLLEADRATKKSVLQIRSADLISEAVELAAN